LLCFKRVNTLGEEFLDDFDEKVGQSKNSVVGSEVLRELVLGWHLEGQLETLKTRVKH
jgi:hypothetical protein